MNEDEIAAEEARAAIYLEQQRERAKAALLRMKNLRAPDANRRELLEEWTPLILAVKEGEYGTESYEQYGIDGDDRRAGGGGRSERLAAIASAFSIGSSAGTAGG